MRRAAVATAPLALYLGVSVVVLGHRVLGDFGTTTIGSGPDPAAFVWILKWWPQALANGWDPLHTNVAYAPGGFNMTWVTAIPGPSYVLAPLTQLAGPIVSYNTLVILTPGLNGWAAFALCRGLGARYAASVLGGYVFGFSTYVMGQSGGHPQTALVALLPLAALLAVRFQRQEISPRRFLVAMAALLIAQFLVSVEVFLTMSMFGAAAFAVGILLFPEQRARGVELLKLTLLAYLATAVVVSPYLYANLSEPDTLSAIDPLTLATDPLSVLVPSRLTAIGGALFESVGNRFTGGGEQGAYLGLPLFLLLAVFGFQRRADRAFQFLLAMLALAFVASLGPRLVVLGGVSAIRLPWTIFFHLPIFKYVIPSRLIVYAWLALALLLALGLSWRGGRPRWALAVAGAALLLPATEVTIPTSGEPYWSSPRQSPEFFRSAEVGELPRGGTVLVLPYGIADNGESMIWQAEAGLGFAMPDGYLSAVVPPDFACWPVDGSLRASSYSAGERSQFLAFLASKQVRAVVVSAAERRAAQPLLAALPGPPRRSGGVYLYRVPAPKTGQPVAPCPGNGA